MAKKNQELKEKMKNVMAVDKKNTKKINLEEIKNKKLVKETNVPEKKETKETEKTSKKKSVAKEKSKKENKINVVELNSLREKEELKEDDNVSKEIKRNKKILNDNQKLIDEFSKESKEKEVFKKRKRKTKETEEKLFEESFVEPEIESEKFGFERDYITNRLKKQTIRDMKKRSDDLFSNETEEDEVEIDNSLVTKGIERYKKNRKFGRKEKQKLIYKILSELIFFLVATVILVTTYFTVYKTKIFDENIFKVISYILIVPGILFLEYGFREKSYKKFLRGIEFLAFAYAYMYYLNVLQVKFIYNQSQKHIIIAIYGYFLIKIFIIIAEEKILHKKTYIDAKQIVK